MSSSVIVLSPFPEDDLVLSPFRVDGFRRQHSLPESIMIYLFVPGSCPIPIRVLESDSIASVKLKIQTCKGVIVKKQRLVFDGRELARNQSLVRDYGVGDGNILHLVVRLSDLRSIIVKTTCGKTFELKVDGNQNVGHVKEEIGKRGKGLVSFHDQKLVYGDEELDEQRIIDDICNDNDTVIHLLVRKSAKVRAKPIDKDLEISIAAHDLERKIDLNDLKNTESKILDKDFWLESVVVNPKTVLSPSIKAMVASAFAGLDKGNAPVPASEGTGGAYFMPDTSGEGYVAVFKPVDEEPMAVNNPQGLPVSTNGEGLKRGTRVGEGALREVAAYILDHPISGPRSFSNDEVGFGGVPPTVMVRCLHEGFNHPGGYEQATKDFKIGSLQMFVKNHGSCEDMGPQAFPVSEVHKISVLDIRLANTDRHGGNILICKGGKGDIQLVPIDHGYCLPENFEDCTFEWLYWPQARQPYTAEIVKYIKSLDVEYDMALLKYHGWKLSAECARVFRISTTLLKKGVERGLSPFTIGNIMCRETLKKKSVIEEIVEEAKEATLPASSEVTFMESISEIMDRRLDEVTM